MYTNEYGQVAELVLHRSTWQRISREIRPYPMIKHTTIARTAAASANVVVTTSTAAPTLHCADGSREYVYGKRYTNARHNAHLNLHADWMSEGRP